jgi:hypothetical protein
MAPPSHFSNRAYALPGSWKPDATDLQFRVGRMAGVGEVRVSAVESAIYLKVDPAVFDESGLRTLLLAHGHASPDSPRSAADGSRS